MELRHLRYFVAVAEAENVTRAALRLHVSQPALSRQIRDLEEELGFSLLERSAKSVRLTPAGKIFLDEARAVLKRAEEAVKTARGVASGSGIELHLGYAPSPTARILPPALRAFQLDMPKARVKLHDLSTEEMLARLRDGKIELAFMVRPGKAFLRGLAFEDLIREELRVAVGRKHPLARSRSITVERIAREPLIALNRAEYPDYYESFDALFAEARVQPNIKEEHDSVSSLIASVEACAGVALVTESVSCMAGTRLKMLTILPKVPALAVGVAWKGDRKLNAAAEKFLESVRRVAAE